MKEGSIGVASWLRRPSLFYPIALVAVVVLAAFLRLSTGLDWDQGGVFHPDERAIMQRVLDCIGWSKSGICADVGSSSFSWRDILSPDRSPLNPGWFNYGSLPLYILKLTEVVSGSGYPDLLLYGRAVSVAADIGTLVLIYALGVRLFSRRVGLLAALLGALAVLHIQLSRFITVDAMLTLFVVATLYFSVRVAQEGKLRYSTLAGVAFGLALATKFAALPLVVIVAVAHILFWVSPRSEVLSTATFVKAGRTGFSRYVLVGGAASALFGAIAFFLGEPYAILDWRSFMRDVTTQSQMVRLISDLPFTRQYIGTTPYLYYIVQLGTWGLGPALGVAAWAGAAWGIVRGLIVRRKSDLVVLGWLVLYFGITGAFGVKFMRYMEPVTPVMFIYGAALLFWISDRLRSRLHSRVRLIAWLPVAVVLLLTFHYAFAFTSANSGIHPAWRASNWLAENAPSGSAVVQEHWEEGVPLRSLNISHASSQLPLYNFDSEDKFEEVFDTLASSDYLVLYSNRLYGTIPRLEERYPLSTLYYEALFSGELGYELVFNETRPISALGVVFYEDPFARVDLPLPEGFNEPQGQLSTIRMGWADESFTVYDHPHVMIFENKGQLDPEDMMYSSGIASKIQEASGDFRRVGLQFSEEEWETQRSGGTWSDIFFLKALPWQFAWLPWLGVIYLIGLVAFPLAHALFGAFPDRGWLLSKPLGLLLAGWATWTFVSYGVAPYNLESVWLGVGVLASLSLITLPFKGRQLLQFLKTKHRRLFLLEMVFLLAFFSFMAVRMANPDLWHIWRGGEKPMDFAYLNAVVRSTLMPPYDPWFAEGHLNYYYFGQFLISWVVKTAGVVPSVAYNLAIPLLFAITISSAFFFGYGFAFLASHRKGSKGIVLSRSPVLAGMLAAFFVAVAGNLDGAVQVFNVIRGAVSDFSSTGFDYWRSSRLIISDPPGNEITEFPFFSFLFADLHAHMIAIPFAMVSTALAVSVFIAVIKSGRGIWFAALILGLVAGAFRAINAWDFPVQMTLAVTFASIGALMGRERSISSRLLHAVALSIVIVVAGYLAFLPFHNRTELFNAGVGLTISQTPIWQYLFIHLPFIVSSLVWLLVESVRLLRGQSRNQGLVKFFPAGVIVTTLIAVSLAGLFWTERTTAVFALGMAFAFAGVSLLAASGKLRFSSSGVQYAAVFASTLAAMAFGLGSLVDIVVLEGDIGRQNTVFKFYVQAWWIMAIAAAIFAWLVWRLQAQSFTQRIGSAGWRVFLVVMVVAMFAYPVLGTQARLGDRFDNSFVSLDGAAYMERLEKVDTPYWCFPSGVEPKALDFASDMRMIGWLQENVKGSPVIVEAIAPEYCWGNRIAVYTGLPSVIGWRWHQTQQRFGYRFEVEKRRSEVEDFYSTSSVQQAARFLSSYDVAYVIAGDLERVFYPDEALEKFQTMEDMGVLKRVYEEQAAVIYEVVRSG